MSAASAGALRRRLWLGVCLFTSAWPAGALGQSMPFVPPRLLRGDLPPIPGPMVVGAGEVMIEVVVDRYGAVTRPVVLRATPPYTEMVLDAVSRWRFEAARATDQNKLVGPIDAPVVITALYPPPGLAGYEPWIGQPPKNLASPSANVAYPTATASPIFPPLARDGGVQLFEVALDGAGQVTGMRAVAQAAGFESTSHDALAKWRFRQAIFRDRPVPSATYVLFGFRPVVVSSVP